MLYIYLKQQTLKAYTFFFLFRYFSVMYLVDSGLINVVYEIVKFKQTFFFKILCLARC